MTPKKRNEIAIQLWEQIFSNLAKQENAALQDPNYEPTEDEARLRKGLKRAGWSKDEIETRIELHKATVSNAPITSPGVNPHVEAMFDALCNDIEAAMERLSLKSHAHTARGVEPRLGPYAAKTNVVMTGESIITVGSFMFRFCGLVARAFTRTLHINPFFWGPDDYEKKSARKYLRDAPGLLKYWMRIYLSFALTGTHIGVPFRPANKSEVVLFEQVARAMEIFAISHEYGHHDLEHGKQIGEDAQREEFKADQFALRICYEVERQPLIIQNPYLASGAGGVVLLLALETLRRIEDLVGGETTRTLDTHPEARLRIDQFDTVAVMKPDEFKVLKGFRVASERIMTAVDSELLPSLEAVPAEILRGVPPSKT